MMQMCQKWTTIHHPHAYARTAVRQNFIRDRAKDANGVARHLIQGGGAPREEGSPDHALTVWEDKELSDKRWRADHCRTGLSPGPGVTGDTALGVFTAEQHRGMVGRVIGHRRGEPG